MGILGWHASGPGDAVGSQVFALGLKARRKQGNALDSGLCLNGCEYQVSTEGGLPRCDC